MTPTGGTRETYAGELLDVLRKYEASASRSAWGADDDVEVTAESLSEVARVGVVGEGLVTRRS